MHRKRSLRFSKGLNISKTLSKATFKKWCHVIHMIGVNFQNKSASPKLSYA